MDIICRELDTNIGDDLALLERQRTFGEFDGFINIMRRRRQGRLMLHGKISRQENSGASHGWAVRIPQQHRSAGSLEDQTAGATGGGFGGLQTARRTLAGYEAMAMSRKGEVHGIGGRDMPGTGRLRRRPLQGSRLKAPPPAPRSPRSSVRNRIRRTHAPSRGHRGSPPVRVRRRPRGRQSRPRSSSLNPPHRIVPHLPPI
jgi:hypothetical protein